MLFDGVDVYVRSYAMVRPQCPYVPVVESKAVQLFIGYRRSIRGDSYRQRMADASSFLEQKTLSAGDVLLLRTYRSRRPIGSTPKTHRKIFTRL